MVSERAAAAGRHPRRRLKAAASFASLGLLLALAAGWLWLMSPLPRLSGRIELAGLTQPVTITRDQHGVPHLRAASRDDLWFALGFVHAQDRFAQMELMRRVGAGRLAEAIGPAGLANDRFMRTLSLRQRAEATLPRLDAPTRAALESYAAGVNAWLTRPGRARPLDLVLLGIEPEPWQAVDSLLWHKLMALNLAGPWRDDILRGRLLRHLSAQRLRELFPGLGTDTGTALSDPGAQALLAALPAAARAEPASNLWIVAGTRSTEGKPLLANDPHLALGTPSPWYLAELEAPGLHLAGATAPGLPFPVIGHTDRFAWGITSAEADTVDLFVEKLEGDSSYRTPDGSRPFLTHDEVIRVKGGPDVSLQVRETRHGPVISDLVGGDLAGPGEVVALAATLLSSDDPAVQSLMRIGLAQDWSGVASALRDIQAPALNIGYADRNGTIALAMVGRIPLRRNASGLLPAKGWTGTGDWTGWLPPARLPLTVNPRSGLLINANDRPTTDPKLAAQIAGHWPPPYRARRLTELLTPRRDLTPAAMSTIQGDIVSLQAVELKDLLAAVEPASERGRAAVRLLADWTGEVRRDRPEPLLLASWAAHLFQALFADEAPELIAPDEPPRIDLLIEALTHHRAWCDDIGTAAVESCDEIIERSLEQTLTDLRTDWGHDLGSLHWGEAHTARFISPVLDQVPVLRSWAAHSLPTDGDNATIDRGGYRPDGPRFPHIHGASLRAVFDLADPAASLFLLTPGQSGHPQSDHYADQILLWRDNLPFRLESAPLWLLTLAPPRD